MISKIYLRSILNEIHRLGNVVDFDGEFNDTPTLIIIHDFFMGWFSMTLGKTIPRISLRTPIICDCQYGCSGHHGVPLTPISIVDLLGLFSALTIHIQTVLYVELQYLHKP